MRLRFRNKTIDVSLLSLRDAMARCEADTGTSTKPTIELLDAVRVVLKRMGIEATYSEAWQVWWGTAEILRRARISQERVADAAAWFHVDATRLSETQLAGLLANIPRVQAQLTLHQGNFDAENYERVYQLALLATGDEAQAQQAKSKALQCYVDARCGETNG